MTIKELVSKHRKTLALMPCSAVVPLIEGFLSPTITYLESQQSEQFDELLEDVKILTHNKG